MAEMIDLAITPQERKDQELEYKSEVDVGPKYPWGLRLHLEHETMTKLGDKLPAVGSEMDMLMRVRVTSNEVREFQVKGKTEMRHSGQLQVIGIQLPEAKKDTKALAESMFGKEGETS